MIAENPALAQPPVPIVSALRSEVAARAGKGAFVYPIVTAIMVRMTELWSDHLLAGLSFAALMSIVALVRLRVTRHVRAYPTDRAYGALVTVVTFQGLAWGGFVAGIFLWYGLIAVTWLGLVVSAGFAAGGTSSMGIDARVHRPFLAGMGVPIIASALISDFELGAVFTSIAAIYCWFLIADARQHASAFEALLRTQHALRIAGDRARAADRDKSAFLAMMSHEIRTPMHAAVGTASMLLETTLDERQRRYAETIVRAGETLVDLINDVLDISRMDAQGTQLEAADFELKPALLEIVQMFEPLVRRAQLEFDYELADSVAISVKGDRRRLQQILVNLIGNALKFTERGGIKLRGHTRPARSGFEIHLAVADSGIGIEPAQLERMFRPFEQADSGITRKYGGSGLGLAICKRLAEAMGGRIEVESTRGQGTTFTVILQLGAATEQRDSVDGGDERAGAANTNAALPVGTRVLVVDDSALNRELAREMLERLGCSVQTASSGTDAVAACRMTDFDIVLMDCQMRDLDGYAATRQIRALGNATARAPILAVTANAFDDDRRRAIEAGMNDLLAKPFGLRALQRSLNRWLQSSGEREAVVSDPVAQATSSSLYPHAIQHISAMLDGALDATVMDRVVEGFLQQWPQRRAILEHSIRSRDIPALREILHALNGAVPYFGIDRLNAALRRLQSQAHADDLTRAPADLQEIVMLVDELAASRKRHRVSRSA